LNDAISPAPKLLPSQIFSHSTLISYRLSQSCCGHEFNIAHYAGILPSEMSPFVALADIVSPPFFVIPTYVRMTIFFVRQEM
jgi:hypothetical protein